MIFSKTLSVFMAMVATGAIATVPANPDFLVEIRTGGKDSFIPIAQLEPVFQAQLFNEHDCAISVGYLNPLFNISGGIRPGEVRPCAVGSAVSTDVAGFGRFGRFSISFMPNNETCDTVTDSCRPVLRFGQETHNMWEADGNCEYTPVPDEPPYDLYSCGFKNTFQDFQG